LRGIFPDKLLKLFYQKSLNKIKFRLFVSYDFKKNAKTELNLFGLEANG